MKKEIFNKIIVSITIILFVIAILSNAVEAKKIDSRAQLISGPNVGNTILLGVGRNGNPLNMFKESDHIYCIQHTASTTKAVYKVGAYVDIVGNKATGYTSKGTKTKISNENLALAYICGEEDYYKGYDDAWNKNGSRMRAIKQYFVTWFKDVGGSSGLNLGDDWHHKGYNIDNIGNTAEKNQVKKYVKSLVANAKNYAKNSNAGMPEVDKKNSSSEIKSISATTSGPFKIKFTGKISSAVVQDVSGNNINVKFSTDKAGKNVVKATDIKSNKNYYIQNSTGKVLKNIKFTLTGKVLTARIWFLKRNDGLPSQKLITVETGKKDVNIDYSINIQPADGKMKIKKVDSETKAGLKGAAFKLYRGTSKNPVGWVKKSGNGYDYTDKQSEAYVFESGNSDTITIENLPYGTYYLSEVKAPEGYELSDQKGYNAKEKRVALGSVVINKDNKVKDITVENMGKMSIKGYVWIDQKANKDDTYNSLYDEGNEKKVAGVTVNLKDKDSNNVIATTTTNANGEYIFDKKVSRGQLGNYYVEFIYNGVKVNNGDVTEDISKYIPVAFNSTNINEIKPNGSRAMMDSVAEKDEDLKGIATTYKGKDGAKETIYGLSSNGNLYKKLISQDGSVLDNINLGIKKIPDADYHIEEDLEDVKIVMKRYTYTYTYGRKGDDSKVAAPKVEWQKKGTISGYTATVYPSDISYDIQNSTEELKMYVRYRIDITNTTNYNFDELYKEQKLKIANLTNKYDTKRYTLNDDNWEEKENGTAVIKSKYKNDVYGNGINKNENKVSFITFSVKHDAIVDILNHPNGIIEDYPTTAEATGYHEYTRKDYSWKNDIVKEQTHITKNDIRNDAAPYLIFKLGEERILSGKVFEDKVVTDDGQKLGNGKYDDKENVVQNAIVELLDVKENETDITKLPVSNMYPRDRINNANINNKELSIPAKVLTDKNGNYTLTGLVPGNYYLRFTYGDGTQKICTVDGKEINTLVSKDYKSTIITNNAAKAALKGGTDLTWYKKLNSLNDSVAIDNLTSRAAVNQGTATNVMAGTAKIDITIENTETNSTNIEVTENGQKALASNNFGGLNLGIIEQPKQDVKFEKIITNIRLTNAQNNVEFSGNPEKDQMSGVTDLDNVNNGGSTYTRAELADEMVSGANLELTYGIKVTNNSDVNYYNNNYYWFGEPEANKEVTLDVAEVTDYLENTLQFKAESSDSRIKSRTEVIDNSERNVLVFEGVGKLYTEKNKARQSDKLKTSDTVALVAGRTLSNKDDDMEFINNAKLTKVNNGKDSRDSSSEGDAEIKNVKPFENNYEAKATATITPPTGEDRQEIIIYAIAGVIALAILSSGIIMIKKIVNK